MLLDFKRLDKSDHLNYYFFVHQGIAFPRIEDNHWYPMFIHRQDLAHFDHQGVTRFLFASQF